MDCWRSSDRKRNDIFVVSDIAVFVPKKDVKLQPTNDIFCSVFTNWTISGSTLAVGLASSQDGRMRNAARKNRNMEVDADFCRQSVRVGPDGFRDAGCHVVVPRRWRRQQQWWNDDIEFDNERIRRCRRRATAPVCRLLWVAYATCMTTSYLRPLSHFMFSVFSYRLYVLVAVCYISML